MGGWVKIVAVDGNTVFEGPEERTHTAIIRSGEYSMPTSFLLTPLGPQSYNTILGIGWLRQLKPIIDWETGTVTIDKNRLDTEPINR